MRTVATLLAVASLVCVVFVLLGSPAMERSMLAALACAILSVAFAVLSLRSPVAPVEAESAELEDDRTR